MMQRQKRLIPATGRLRFGLILMPLALILGTSIPRAVGQLTMGTVSGSVRHPQAAAVPGVTASLVSEIRGTRLPDAISSTNGDFVIPNVPPATYTLEITHKGYKGWINGWDVVNEALNEDGTMRQSPWHRTIGEDYLRKALQFAHEADPRAELYYNDRGIRGAPLLNMVVVVKW